MPIPAARSMDQEGAREGGSSRRRPRGRGGNGVLQRTVRPRPGPNPLGPAKRTGGAPQPSRAGGGGVFQRTVGPRPRPKPLGLVARSGEVAPSANASHPASPDAAGVTAGRFRRAFRSGPGLRPGRRTPRTRRSGGLGAAGARVGACAPWAETSRSAPPGNRFGRRGAPPPLGGAGGQSFGFITSNCASCSAEASRWCFAFQSP